MEAINFSMPSIRLKYLEIVCGEKVAHGSYHDLINMFFPLKFTLFKWVHFFSHQIVGSIRSKEVTQRTSGIIIKFLCNFLSYSFFHILVSIWAHSFQWKFTEVERNVLNRIDKFEYCCCDLFHVTESVCFSLFHTFMIFIFQTQTASQFLWIFFYICSCLSFVQG